MANHFVTCLVIQLLALSSYTNCQSSFVNGTLTLQTLFDWGYNLTTTELRLGFRGIISVQPGTFQAFPNLRKLVLSNNLLTRLPFGMFSNLTNLTELEIYFNRIEVIDDFIFQDLANLAILDLSNNFIK